MQTIMKSWINYGVAAAMFAVGINLIYLVLPLAMMIVYDRVLFSFSKATLAALMLMVLFSLMMMGLILYCRRRMLMQLGNGLAQKIMPFVLDAMHREAAALNRHRYTRGITDLERVRHAIVQGRFLVFLDLPWMVLYIALLFFMHPLAGWVALAAVLLMTIALALLMVFLKKRCTVADVAFHAGAEGIRTALQDAELVTSMGILPPLRQRHLEGYGKVLSLRAEADIFDSAMGSALRFLAPTAVAAVFCAGSIAFFANEITTGAIFAMVMITIRLLSPLEDSLINMQSFIETMASCKRLHRHISLQKTSEKLPLPPPAGKVAAESLSLALNGKPVLHTISFTLEPGESLGIIGPSAAGKTSLCRILLGIWPATAGKVRLDGAEINQWPEEELRMYVGYMPQEPVLFPATVAENIARLQQPDPDKVVAAAQKAGVHEHLLKLPQGYATKLDQSGKNLSAGQRQLIALARALYDAPRFVVLDEPHTHLDDLGMQCVFQTIRSMKQERITAIVVTDRPHILTTLDKLLVIREGQTALFGPAKDVLNQLLNRQQQPQQAAA